MRHSQKCVDFPTEEKLNLVVRSNDLVLSFFFFFHFITAVKKPRDWSSHSHLTGLKLVSKHLSWSFSSGQWLKKNYLGDMRLCLLETSGPFLPRKRHKGVMPTSRVRWVEFSLLYIEILFSFFGHRILSHADLKLTILQSRFWNAGITGMCHDTWYKNGFFPPSLPPPTLHPPFLSFWCQVVQACLEPTWKQSPPTPQTLGSLFPKCWDYRYALPQL